jgi:hypothetical protein
MRVCLRICLRRSLLVRACARVCYLWLREHAFVSVQVPEMRSACACVRARLLLLLRVHVFVSVQVPEMRSACARVRVRLLFVAARASICVCASA